MSENIFPNFTKLSPHAISGHGSENIVINYVLLVLCMRLCLHIIAGIDHTKEGVYSNRLTRGQHRTVNSLMSITSLFYWPSFTVTPS